MMSLSSAVLSHPGLRREANEDSVCARPDLGLFLVADGMGGHAAGEVASRLAVAGHRDVHQRHARRRHQHDVAVSRTTPTLSLDGNRLTAAFRLANRRINAAMQGDEALRGMATTAAALLVNKGKPVVAHVGDSRVVPVARRHADAGHAGSFVGHRAGARRRADRSRRAASSVAARRHARAVGRRRSRSGSLANSTCKTGDRILLCSDGLSGVVPPDRVASIIGQQAPLDETCQDLIDAANEAGGPDNITVAMLQVDVA